MDVLLLSVNDTNVTMKDGFYEKNLVSLTAYLESSDAIFTTLKEENKFRTNRIR